MHSDTIEDMFRWWAFWRRVQYGVLFLIVLALCGLGIYMQYAYTPPTCFDGIMNGLENGVDCGGSCVRVCGPVVSAPVVAWAESFKIIDGQYNVVAYVENPNSNIGTAELPYTFTLSDANGVIVERSGKTVFNAGGITPIFEGRVMTGSRIPTQTTLTFDTDDVVWLPTTRDVEQFSVVSRALSSADRLPRLVAGIRNNSLDDARNIEVVVTLFDSQKNPLTASRTFVEYFPGRTEDTITFTWPEPIAHTLRSCDVPTDVMLAIDLSGSMNDDGGVPPEPISSVLSSAEAFVERLGILDTAGLVTYATDASLVERLTPDIGRVAEVVSALSIEAQEETGSTNTGDAFKLMREELNSSRHNEDARKVAVLLTDGLTNAPGDEPEAYALSEAETMKRSDVQVYTIGLGSRLNKTFLSSLASTPEMYYTAPTISELRGIYESISKEICEEGPTVVEIIPKSVPKFPEL